MKLFMYKIMKIFDKACGKKMSSLTWLNPDNVETNPFLPNLDCKVFSLPAFTDLVHKDTYSYVTLIVKRIKKF